MKFIVQSSKSFEITCQDLQSAVTANSFGVLHIHDIRETMGKKGVQFDKNVRVFEVCNPHKAKDALNISMEICMALPCRVSVWEQDGEVKIGMISPVSTINMACDCNEAKAMGEEVERIMKKIINDTK
mgnify:CR=1 FL=1